ncbi:MAG: CDGSH iron-sulfur domain-containing protein [Proteobacteria bacterium]|nr:CDGSH iron-sulfur domain-containing protein [Pseudomonadota bacterium]
MASGKVIKYTGDRATVSWHSGLCIHIGECGRAKGELFVAGRKPWCQPDVSADDEIEDVILRCPTGALTVDYEDGSHVESADPENSVHVAYNGPLFLRGDLSIDDAPSDAPGLKFRAALCRCGKSRNKPYCDNSHEKDEFRDYGAVGESGDDNASRGGTLNVQPIKDGPLVCKGNVTIFNSSGRESFHGAQVVLCRCGASNNKPFCDGQHVKIGFKSD